MGPAVGLEGLAQGTIRHMGYCVAGAVDCNRAIFALKMSVLLRYNLIDGRFKGTAFPAPSFAKLASS